MAASEARQSNAIAKKRPLKRMFDAVPDRYDLLNRILTLRLDESWRRRAARRCVERSTSRILDLCCGTGDLALHIRKQANRSVEIFGLDYSPPMLQIAEAKARRDVPGQAVRFVEGDAGNMDFPAHHFDVVGIAFGFRNLTWKNSLKDTALAEVHRVLRPGGAFVIVETSQPSNRLLRTGFHFYLKFAVGTLGAGLSGNTGAYRYLAESARQFFSAAEVSAMLSGAGFDVATIEPLLGGAAAIHVAEKRA